MVKKYLLLIWTIIPVTYIILAALNDPGSFSDQSGIIGLVVLVALDYLPLISVFVVDMFVHDSRSLVITASFLFIAYRTVQILVLVTTSHWNVALGLISAPILMVPIGILSYLFIHLVLKLWPSIFKRRNNADIYRHDSRTTPVKSQQYAPKLKNDTQG